MNDENYREKIEEHRQSIEIEEEQQYTRMSRSSRNGKSSKNKKSKKTKLQANLTDEHQCKYFQQNTSKSNTTIH